MSFPSSLRILVVDDERDHVLTVMMVLRRAGHEVRGAYSGKDGLRVAAEFDPDVVILDIVMPDISGYDVAREIRKSQGPTRPFLIGVSGVHKQGSDVVLSEMVGFNHYVTKPYDFATILRLIAPLQQANATPNPANRAA